MDEDLEADVAALLEEFADEIAYVEDYVASKQEEEES